MAALGFLVSGKREEQVGDSIEIAKDLLVRDQAGTIHCHCLPFGAPHGRSGKVEPRGAERLTRKDELRRQRMLGDQRIDVGLSPLGHVRSDLGDSLLELGLVLPCGCKLGPDKEHLSLEAYGDYLDSFDESTRAGHTEGRYDLIQGAVDLRPDVILGHPASVKQTGGPIVALPRVDLHHANPMARRPLEIAGYAARK